MFGKYFSKLVSVLMDGIFGDEVNTQADTYDEYIHYIKLHERQKKCAMTDQNNVTSDICNKYNVGEKVVRHLKAVFAIILK